MTHREAELNTWLGIVMGEFKEMPGLQLTRPQICRLWGLDASLCDALIDRLQATDFLRVTSSGFYVMADGAPGPRNGPANAN